MKKLLACLTGFVVGASIAHAVTLTNIPNMAASGEIKRVVNSNYAVISNALTTVETTFVGFTSVATQNVTLATPSGIGAVLIQTSPTGAAWIAYGTTTNDWIAITP